jgi:hypothetical protein
MIQNYDNFSKENANFNKISTLYSTITNTKHVIYWGNYMYFNNKLQNISFKNSFI